MPSAYASHTLAARLSYLLCLHQWLCWDYNTVFIFILHILWNDSEMKNYIISLFNVIIRYSISLTWAIFWRNLIASGYFFFSLHKYYIYYIVKIYLYSYACMSAFCWLKIIFLILYLFVKKNFKKIINYFPNLNIFLYSYILLL
jgi:hypothetical protein